MGMVLAEVLYDNALRDDDITYSGAVTLGFEPENAVDWRDFSLFRPAVGTSTFDVIVPANHTIDTAYLWPLINSGASITSVAIQYESAPATFTTLYTFTPTTNSILSGKFGAVTVLAGRKVRVVFTGVVGDFDIRQVTVGRRLQFPIGQWVGVAPPSLVSGVVMENVISVNGSVIARNVRRTEKKAMINLNYLEQSWVRNTWDPFAQHATRYAFWYSWNPVGYPAELAFAVAEEISAPTNSTPVPRMAVEMPLRVLTS